MRHGETRADESSRSGVCNDCAVPELTRSWRLTKADDSERHPARNGERHPRYRRNGSADRTRVQHDGPHTIKAPQVGARSPDDVSRETSLPMWPHRTVQRRGTRSTDTPSPYTDASGAHLSKVFDRRTAATEDAREKIRSSAVASMDTRIYVGRLRRSGSPKGQFAAVCPRSGYEDPATDSRGPAARAQSPGIGHRPLVTSH
jgi:hypothetical protein